jgi:molybdate transport system ATP-binding protein
VGRHVTGVGITCRQAGLVLNERQVLAPLNLDIKAGSGIVLLGPNGAGKTQLLKLLGGERWPTPTAAGDERRDYRDAADAPLDAVEVFPRVAFVGGEWQDKYYRYDWNFTVHRVVATGVRNAVRPGARLTATERARVREVLARFSLQPLARRQFLTLSYGERRRVLIARALAGNPGLVLLDEVHNGLDRETRTLLDNELTRLHAAGVTVILAAHRADDVPAGIARAIVLEGGAVTYDGALSDAPRHWLAVDGETAMADLPVPTGRSTAPLIRLERVRLYRDYRPVIQDLTWTVGANEHWAIVGANGSGKSTLLQAVYGLLPFASVGRVVRRGVEPGDHMDEWRRRIGFVSPELQMEYLEDLSAEDFVVSGERLSFGLLEPSTRPERRRARAALERVGFPGDPEASVRRLSYGQRRLALFARALVLNPEAVLLDEPLTGLDAPYRARVKGLLSACARAGVQLLIAAHHVTDLIAEIQHVLVIRQGRGHPEPREGIAKASA